MDLISGFFNPRTVALIGATANPKRAGRQLHLNLAYRFGDDYYPVNVKGEEIDGRPSYRSIEDVPAEIDVAVVFVPSAAVPETLRQCGRKGIKRVIIESAGFAEVGPEGQALADECMKIAREFGMRLWGPNCMGMINVHEEKVLSFMLHEAWKGNFIKGNVSLVVQSGMLSAGFLLHILSRNPFGLAKVCSIGNKMDIDETDLLEYFVNDPDTGVIAMYLESLERGRKFFELARATGKPVVVLKGGRTSAGARAAASHTASLAQNDAVLDSAFRQAGIIRVRGMKELMDVARSLGVAGNRRLKRARVAVLTFSGGAGVVTSDDLNDRGLEVAELSPETLARIKKVFPEWMDPGNPVDLYPAIERNGPQRTFGEAIAAVMEDPGVDAVYAHMWAPPTDKPLLDYDLFAKFIRHYNKPFLAWVMGYGPAVAEMQKQLESRGIPVAEEIRRGVRMIAAITAGR